MERRKIGTLQELADIAEISQTTIYSAVDSYSWRTATLDAIANALGVTPISLLTVDEDAPDTDKTPEALTESPEKKQAVAGPRPRRAALDIDTSRIPPDKAQAEAERRAALLAQAAGRTGDK